MKNCKKTLVFYFFFRYAQNNISLENENCYKLGIAHGYSRQVVLVNLFNSSEEIYTNEIASYIRRNFLINSDTNISNEAEVLLERIKRILSVMLKGNVIEIVYQKYCEYCKEEGRSRDRNLETVDKQAFTKCILNEYGSDIEKITEHYINNNAVLLFIFNNLISNNNNDSQKRKNEVQKNESETQATKKHPKVLITYSHDSESHRTKVRELYDQLCNDGVDITYDQGNPIPEAGWPVWMEINIGNSDFVLIVSTEDYLKKWKEEEQSGVRFESYIIRNILYRQGMINVGRKFIPVVFYRDDEKYIPELLQGFTYYALSKENDDEYQPLLRHLLE